MAAAAPARKTSRTERNARALERARGGGRTARAATATRTSGKAAAATATRTSGKAAAATATRTSGKAAAATATRTSGKAAAATATRASRTGAAATATRTATKAAAATRPAPATPRRKSGPAPRPKRVAAPPRTNTRPRTTARPRTATRPIARAAQGSAALVLDRLLRGRGWVGLVGVLLVGIVFLNVSVLELNRGIATTSSRAAKLERSNSKLRARVGKLDSAERIQREAEARGFVLPQPGDVSYLKPHSSDATRAAKQIEKPNGSAPGGTAAATPTSSTTTTTPSTSTTSAPVTSTGTTTPSATPTTTTTTTAAAPATTAVTTAAPTAAASP